MLIGRQDERDRGTGVAFFVGKTGKPPMIQIEIVDPVEHGANNGRIKFQ